jgi:transposase
MGKKAVDISVKWQIIALKKETDKEKKLSNVKIAHRCGVSEHCVRTTWAKYVETNDVKSGTQFNRRPRKLTKEDESIIFREVRKEPRQSLRNITSKFNSSYPGREVSSMTVQRVLKRKGINSYVASKKPFLSVLDRIKRLKWCRERRNWSVYQWSKIIFSDESNFEVLNRKRRIYIKRFADEKFKNQFVVNRVQAGGGSVGIWGCFSMAGTGICNLYTGRINQHSYI